jgi:HSP20 family protein
MAMLPIKKRRRPSWMTLLGEEGTGDLFFDRLWNEWANWQSDEWVPSFNLSEKAGKYTLTAELPGVDKDSISVTIENSILTISGKKESFREEEGARYYLKETACGAFSRSIRLPGEVEEEKVEATFKDGVLTLEMPLKQEPKTKRIEIK